MPVLPVDACGHRHAPRLLMVSIAVLHFLWTSMVLMIIVLRWALGKDLRSARHAWCWALGFFTLFLVGAVIHVVVFMGVTATRSFPPPVTLPRGQSGQGGAATPIGRAAEQPAGLGNLPAGHGAGAPTHDCTASSSSWPWRGDPAALRHVPRPRQLAPIRARATAAVADGADPPLPRAVTRRLPAPAHIGHVA